MRAYTLANIGSMVAVLIGVVNLLTFRELWVLLAAVAILVFLAVYALKRNVSFNDDNKHITTTQIVKNFYNNRDFCLSQISLLNKKSKKYN